jgi:hypothetical protein
MNERRSAPRHPLRHPLGCLLSTSDGRRLGRAVVEDVSVGGIRLFVTRHHTVGETLAVDLACPALVPLLHLNLIVMWCQPAPGGGFLLGGQFLEPLKEDQVRALAGNPGQS